MNVNVYWLSWHEAILARGYADQGFLEAVMARTQWVPRGAVTFTHHEVRGTLSEREGGIVMLPARHHVDLAARFVEEIDRLPWSLVILCGDEEWAFPWVRVKPTERRRVWAMQPVPAQNRLNYVIPGGWYPGTHEGVRWPGMLTSVDDRPDWFFAGQVTHERRQQLADVLAPLADERNAFIATERYLEQKVPQDEYWRMLALAKVIPCPSGPMTVDTARALEAFEAGCVPIVDVRAPSGRPQFDYWRTCFGDTFPAPRCDDWREFPAILAAVLDDWPRVANRCWAWWQGWKADTSNRLDLDVRDAMGLPIIAETVDDEITVIVTTSPTVKHPSTADIESTVASIRAQLPWAEIVVAFDGVRPEQADLAAAYDEYTRRVLWLCNFEWRNTRPFVSAEWLHQAGLTRAVLADVVTPLMLFVEHDTPLVGPIDWQGCVAAITSGDAHLIRFHHETTMLDVHRGLCVDDAPRTVDGVAMWRSMQWWQRPHLATTSWYRDVLDRFVPTSARTMIEDRLYGIVSNDWHDYGESGWARWRIWTYAVDVDVLGIKRSTHLDGRAGAPKYDMVFE